MTDDQWWLSAACAGQAPAWDLDTRHRADAPTLIRICNGCPVRKACAADTRIPGRAPRSTVRGGIQWSDDGRPMRDGLILHGKLCPCGEPTETRQSKYCSDACRQTALTDGRNEYAAARYAGGRRPEPIKHGTQYGAAAHRRRDEAVCAACLQADRVAAADRQTRRRHAGLTSRHVCGDCGGALTTHGGKKIHARSGRVDADCPEPVRNVVRRGDYEAGRAA